LTIQGPFSHEIARDAWPEIIVGNPVSVHYSCPKRRTDTGFPGFPQDPTDEPAEKHLERIRQQRQPATKMYNAKSGVMRNPVSVHHSCPKRRTDTGFLSSCPKRRTDTGFLSKRRTDTGFPPIAN